MTDADIKALSLILDHISKEIVKAKEEIIKEIRRAKLPSRAKPIYYGVKLRRAQSEALKLRMELKQVHQLLNDKV